MFSLGEGQVLVLDCQSTGANPQRGSLLEIGWAPARAADSASIVAADVTAHLVALPEGETIPDRVARITGVADADLQAAVAPARAWRELVDAASTIGGPAVIHFARFEQPFLRELHRGCNPDAVFPLEIVCTHEISRRALPELPRRGLRALAGYFGFSTDVLRRSAGHVAATAFVWAHLVELLDHRFGVATAEDLREWLAEPAPAAAPGRAYPMPRHKRLALAERPGVYRMLRSNGDLLYVGKARSLKRRVNSYFQKQSRIPDRTLEMLTQARDLEVTETATALEAALLEVDEIKRLAPPYNVALVDSGRSSWFASADMSSFCTAPDRVHRLGPLVSPEALGAFNRVRSWVAAAAPEVSDETVEAVIGPTGDDGPGSECFAEGLGQFRATLGGPGSAGRLLELGAELWRVRMERRAAEGDGERQDAADDEQEPAWDPDRVERSLQRVCRVAAHALRRARWLCALSEASLVWSGRLLVFESGRVVLGADVRPGTPAPVPPGLRRGPCERRRAMTYATCDRLRVLTTELRRVAANSDDIELRFGHRALQGERLRKALVWV